MRRPVHADLLGIVPVSWYSLAVMGLGLALTAIGLRPIVARTGWRRWPIAGAGVALTSTVALTLGSWGSTDVVRAPGCTFPGDTDVLALLLEAGHDLESALNAVLLVPLGLLLVLGIRKVLPPLLVVLVLPGVIEMTQLAIPGRVCSLADYLLNVAGGVVGVGLGAAAVLGSRSVRSP